MDQWEDTFMSDEVRVKVKILFFQTQSEPSPDAEFGQLIHSVLKLIFSFIKGIHL